MRVSIHSHWATCKSKPERQQGLLQWHSVMGRPASRPLRRPPLNLNPPVGYCAFIQHSEPVMTDANRIRDFDPATHAVIRYCGQCGRESRTAGARDDHPRAASAAEVRRVRVERGGNQDCLERGRRVLALVRTSDPCAISLSGPGGRPGIGCHTVLALLPYAHT